MNNQINRRGFIGTSVAAVTCFATTGSRKLFAENEPSLEIGTHIYKSLKWGMIKHDGLIDMRLPGPIWYLVGFESPGTPASLLPRRCQPFLQLPPLRPSS